MTISLYSIIETYSQNSKPSQDTENKLNLIPESRDIIQRVLGALVHIYNNSRSEPDYTSAITATRNSFFAWNNEGDNNEPLEPCLPNGLLK